MARAPDSRFRLRLGPTQYPDALTDQGSKNFSLWTDLRFAFLYSQQDHPGYNYASDCLYFF